MLVVRNCKAYSREIEEAVLEHHERMDGSGYPRGISGDAISSMGRILMLAEVVSAFYDKYRDMPAQRLSLVLRMNHNRFDRQLMQHIHAMLRADTAQPVQAREHTQAEVRREIATLAAIFSNGCCASASFRNVGRPCPVDVLAFTSTHVWWHWRKRWPKQAHTPAIRQTGWPCSRKPHPACQSWC